jgi:hypothetical protein
MELKLHYFVLNSNLEVVHGFPMKHYLYDLEPISLSPFFARALSSNCVEGTHEPCLQVCNQTSSTAINTELRNHALGGINMHLSS